MSKHRGGVIGQQQANPPTVTYPDFVAQQPTKNWEPTRLTLDRPMQVAGANLAGLVRVGKEQAPGPSTPIQDRAWWVEVIELLPSGWVRCTAWDGKQKLLSPSVVAWIE